MTIRFLKPWNGYQPDAVVSGLTNEAALIAGGLASDDLDGGNDGRTYEAKFATDASGNVTGLVGPDGVLSLSTVLPTYLSLGMPVVADDATGVAGAYVDFGTDGTGSVTAQYPDAGYLGGSGVKLTWSSGGTYCRVGKQFPSNIAVPEGSIGVFVKWPLDQGVAFTIYLSNDTGWTNYASAIFSGNYVVPNGWLLALIPQSSFTLNGSFAWATGVRRFRFSINSSATYPDVYYGGIVFGSRAIPLVTFSCDDGFESQLTVAAPILSKYGYSATAYLAGSIIGSTNYLTSSQAQTLQSIYGWDLANHGWGHLHYPTLTSSQMISDFTSNRTWLQGIGSTAFNHFAYPYGQAASGVDASIPAEVLSGQGAVTGRLAATDPGRGYQIYPGIGLVDPMHIKATQLGGAANTVANIKSKIDNAITYGESLNLYFHNILDQYNPAGTGGPTPADGNEYYKDDFEEIVSYVKRKELAGSLMCEGKITKIYAISNGVRPIK